MLRVLVTKVGAPAAKGTLGWVGEGVSLSLDGLSLEVTSQCQGDRGTQLSATGSW